MTDWTKSEEEDDGSAVSGYEIAEDIGLPRILLSGFFEAVTATLAAGKPVRLKGIGVLSPVVRAARQVHNPNEPGTWVSIPQKIGVKYTISRRLKAAVNGER